MIDLSNTLNGLNSIEATMNTGLVVVMVSLWSLFLWSLRSPKRSEFWFRAVAFLHLAPLPLALVDSNQREALQFLRFALLGGIAVVIGVPHHGWEPGKRLRPRLVLTLAVTACFGALYVWISNWP